MRAIPARGTRAAHVAFLAALSALGVVGCALTSKSEAAMPRYFSPDRLGGVARTAPPAPGATGELRLGRVTGASHLDERLVYRDSEYELGYYQERRWTESPDQYLKRRIARVLFEDRGVHQVVGGAAETLELELLAFDEIRAPRHVARVRATVRLHDQRAVRWEETLTVEQPVTVAAGHDAAEGAVEAIGLALTTLVDRVADRVVSELAALPVVPDQAAPPSSLSARGARRP